jgi:hypothetical protein
MDWYELKLNSCPLKGLPTYDGSEVLTAVTTRSTIFWLVSLYT